jgi:hypothetical protein
MGLFTHIQLKIRECKTHLKKNLINFAEKIKKDKFLKVF